MAQTGQLVAWSELTGGNWSSTCTYYTRGFMPKSAKSSRSPSVLWPLDKHTLSHSGGGLSESGFCADCELPAWLEVITSHAIVVAYNRHHGIYGRLRRAWTKHGEKSMKVLAINASPRINNSNTSVVLGPFLDGMKEEGADVELVHAKELDIKPCLGCWTCILKTPMQCVQKDDMGQLFMKMFTANIIVWATPVFCEGPTAQLKTIVDRTFVGASINPGYEIRDGHQRLKGAEGFAPPKMALVSTCGLHEMDNFDALLNWVDALGRMGLYEFAGALLRPHANVFHPLFKMKLDIDDILQAANDAGRQLISNGKISKKTLSTVSRDILTRDEYIQLANKTIQEERARRQAGATGG